MQNQRTPGRSTERTKSVREARANVVLWRPDILVAPGAILASLGEVSNGTGVRHGMDVRWRSERARLSAALDVAAGVRLDRLLDPPSVPVAGIITERGWR